MFAALRRLIDDYVDFEGGLSIIAIDGLLLIPVLFAAFFYPVQVLTLVAITGLVVLAGYEGYVVWRRRHPHRL